MEIKNESLSDRLNNYKNHISNSEESEIPQTPQTNGNNELNKALNNLFSSLFLLSIFLIKSIIYGYALHILLNSSWNFFEIGCIGIAINYIFQQIESIIILFKYKK